MIPKNRSLISGSKASVGSSRIRNSGLLTRALAISARCCWPPESSPIGLSGPDPRASTVIFTAHDGYTTSFPLSYLMDGDIIMAYRMNNITLPADRGYPFELVAEDKWGYKWIKWVEKIELTGNAGYRGYWEQRGYSNTGNLNQSFFF